MREIPSPKSVVPLDGSRPTWTSNPYGAMAILICFIVAYKMRHDEENNISLVFHRPLSRLSKKIYN